MGSLGFEKAFGSPETSASSYDSGRQCSVLVHPRATTLMVEEVETDTVSPVKCAEEVAHRIRATVTGSVLFGAGNTVTLNVPLDDTAVDVFA